MEKEKEEKIQKEKCRCAGKREVTERKRSQFSSSSNRCRWAAQRVGYLFLHHHLCSPGRDFNNTSFFIFLLLWNEDKYNEQFMLDVLIIHRLT
jgi:hypothetical protein